MTDRTELVRYIDQPNIDMRALAVGMLNPSLATSTTNDPTIRRLMGFTKRLGFGSLHVFNPYTHVSPDPLELYAWWERLTFFEKRAHQRQAVGHAKILIARRRPAAIVNASGQWYARDEWIREFWWSLERYVSINELPSKFYTLGLTKDGSPKHPMARGRSRIPDNAQLTPWSAA